MCARKFHVSALFLLFCTSIFPEAFLFPFTLFKPNRLADENFCENKKQKKTQSKASEKNFLFAFWCAFQFIIIMDEKFWSKKLMKSSVKRKLEVKARKCWLVDCLLWKVSARLWLQFDAQKFSAGKLRTVSRTNTRASSTVFLMKMVIRNVSKCEGDDWLLGRFG